MRHCGLCSMAMVTVSLVHIVIHGHSRPCGHLAAVHVELLSDFRLSSN